MAARLHPWHLWLASAIAAGWTGSACVSSMALPNAGLRAVVRPLAVERGVVAYRLDNGLRVALVPDPRTNLVSVDVRYTTGALDDAPGRSGQAHLAEHLSFGLVQPGGVATVAQRLDEAALVYNAYTSWDETHFASLALAPSLPDVLAIEATRMSAGCDRLAPGVLARELDVVANELRERDGRGPWGQLAARLLGADHPYARPVGGADVGVISLDDACRFLVGRYAPARAILVIGGAIDAGAVRAMVAARFGRIGRDAAPPRSPPSIAVAGESVLHAELADPTAVIAFAALPWGSPGRPARNLAIDLWRRRILDEGRAVGIRRVERGFLGAAGGGVELVAITVRDATLLRPAVEAAFRARGRLLDGDFAVARREQRALAVHQELAALDSFAGLGARVADALQHGGGAGALLGPVRELDGLWRDGLERQVSTLGIVEMERFVDRGPGSMALVRAVRSLPVRGEVHVAWLLPDASGARRKLPDGARRLHVSDRRAPVDLDEADRPLAVPAPRPGPPVREVLLGNRLRVILAPVPGSALVEARLVFPAGLAHEPPDRTGVAVLAAHLLEHDMERGYSMRDLHTTSWVLGLGARMAPEVGATSTVFRVSGAARYADWHLWRLFWLIEQGVYSDDTLARVRADNASREPDDRQRRLDRALAGALLGGVTVRERDVEALARIGLREIDAYRRAHFVPDGATLIVAGGFDPGSMLAEIRQLAGPWRGPARPSRAESVYRQSRCEAIEQNPCGVALTRGNQRRLAVVDDAADQVSIALAFPATRLDGAERLVVAEMVAAQARSVRLRIGATYGLQAGYTILASSAPALVVSGDADPARAGDVLVALLSSLDELRIDGAAFRSAFVVARRQVMGRVLARVADTAALADELETLARIGWTGRRREDLVAQVAALTPAAVAAALARDLDRQRMVIALAGPHGAVQAGFRAARLDGVQAVP